MYIHMYLYSYIYDLNIYSFVSIIFSHVYHCTLSLFEEPQYKGALHVLGRCKFFLTSENLKSLSLRFEDKL